MKHIILVKLLFLIMLPVGSQEVVSFRSSDELIYIPHHVDNDILFIPSQAAHATIYLSNGKTENKTLQYNILQDAMQYPGRGSQILFLDADNGIDSLVFADYLFIHNPKEGYLEVRNEGPVKLLLKRNLYVHHEVIQIGAYGAENRTASIKTYHQRRDGGFEKAFTLRYEMTIENRERQLIEVFARKSDTYLIEKEGELIKIENRRALLRSFPGHRSDLKRYIRQNNIRLDNENDLLQLVDFLITL